MKWRSGCRARPSGPWPRRCPRSPGRAEPRPRTLGEQTTSRHSTIRSSRRSSDDQEIPRFTWWDHRGTAEWVQYDFAKPTTVSTVSVYWFDDTGRGGCRVPAVVETPVPRRRLLGAHPGDGRMRHGPGLFQQRVVSTRHDRCAASRGSVAAGFLGRDSGVAGRRCGSVIEGLVEEPHVVGAVVAIEESDGGMRPLLGRRGH